MSIVTRKAGLESEVSTFALDAYFAAGRPADAALERHLEGCARCRAYLASLEAFAAETLPVAPPASKARAKRRWALPSAAFGALALAAGVALFLRGQRARDEGDGEYVGAKGAPAVQVLVHRPSGTSIWDGRSPVRPGDALALRVDCEGLAHVAVAAKEPAGWGRLADAACAAGDAPLPFTLVVDDSPGDEGLAVVLSRDVLDDDALVAAIGEGRHSGDVWAVGFVLSKDIR